jgi:hypothetical protein
MARKLSGCQNWTKPTQVGQGEGATCKPFSLGAWQGLPRRRGPDPGPGEEQGMLGRHPGACVPTEDRLEGIAERPFSRCPAARAVAGGQPRSHQFPAIHEEAPPGSPAWMAPSTASTESTSVIGSQPDRLMRSMVDMASPMKSKTDPAAGRRHFSAGSGSDLLRSVRHHVTACPDRVASRPAPRSDPAPLRRRGAPPQ